MEVVWNNPQEEIKEEGYLLIDNPERRKKGEDPLIAIPEKEVLERWIWLVYVGKDPEGWRCPDNLKEWEWHPQPNSWKEANEEEMKIITDAIRNDKALHYKTITEKYKKVSALKEKKISYVELPVSITFVIPEHHMIVRKWKDPVNWELLGYGEESEEAYLRAREENKRIDSLRGKIGEVS